VFRYIHLNFSRLVIELDHPIYKFFLKKFVQDGSLYGGIVKALSALYFLWGYGGMVDATDLNNLST
jgi:hypothetical protein